MLKKLVLFVGGFLALNCAPAQADTFVPTGIYTFTGPVASAAPFSLFCDLSITIVASGSDADVTNASMSGGLCGLITFTGVWNIDVVAPTTPWATATRLVFRNVAMFDMLGNPCGPDDVFVDWTPGATPAITFPIGTEVQPPVGACGIEGVIRQTGGTALVITK